ncbi:hypothetical protein DY000_02023894 [Brassica cretica]|uniref:Uncharacterized protein n=1 Tax=Brassica cretica TaxID=69181 RepID=A0ABQ7EAC2_BRACR|nr:hypothetical protein DY000_02023894 [Brassica cretica]
MENHLCFDPGTTHAPLSPNPQEPCKEFGFICFVPDLFVKFSSSDIKRFGLEKHFQNDNDIPSGLVLSFDQFLEHSKGFDHLEKSFELDLQQPIFCARKSFDSFVFKENSFSLSSYGHELFTGILLASTYALDDFMGKEGNEINNILRRSPRSEEAVVWRWQKKLPGVVEVEPSKKKKIGGDKASGGGGREGEKTETRELGRYSNGGGRRRRIEEEEDDGIDTSTRCIRRCGGDGSWRRRLGFCFRLKHVLHVLEKETLISDLNNYMSCTYDSGILMSALSVQDRQVQSRIQSQRSESIDRDYKA